MPVVLGPLSVPKIQDGKPTTFKCNFSDGFFGMAKRPGGSFFEVNSLDESVSYKISPTRARKIR